MRKSEIAYLMYVNGYRLDHIAKHIYGSNGRRERKAAWKLIYDAKRRIENDSYIDTNEYTELEPYYHPKVEKLRKSILTIGSLLFDPPVLSLMEYSFRVGLKLLNNVSAGIDYLAAAYVAWYITLLDHDAVLRINQLREIAKLLVKDGQIERFNKKADRLLKSCMVQSILL